MDTIARHARKNDARSIAQACTNKNNDAGPGSPRQIRRYCRTAPSMPKTAHRKPQDELFSGEAPFIPLRLGRFHV
jgi:hypothetical protein